MSSGLAFEPVLLPAAVADFPALAGALMTQPPAGAPFAALLDTELAAAAGSADVSGKPAPDASWSEALPFFISDTWRPEAANGEEAPVVNAGDAGAAPGPDSETAFIEDEWSSPGAPPPDYELERRPSDPDRQRPRDEADGRVDVATIAPHWLTAPLEASLSGTTLSDTPAGPEVNAQEASAAPVRSHQVRRPELQLGHQLGHQGGTIERLPDEVGSGPDVRDARGAGTRSQPVQSADATVRGEDLVAFPEGQPGREMPAALTPDALQGILPVNASGVARSPQAESAEEQAPYDRLRDVPLPRWTGFMALPGDRIDALRRSVAARAQAPGGTEPSSHQASAREVRATTAVADFDHVLPIVSAGVRPLLQHEAAAAPHVTGGPAESAGIPNENGVRSSIVHAIRMQARDGTGTALIKLDPAFLGTVTISVHVEGGAVTATLHADDPQVRSWMAAAEPTLRQGLAEHGLTLDRLEVADERGSAHAGADGRGRRRQPASPPYVPPRRDQPGTFEVVV